MFAKQFAVGAAIAGVAAMVCVSAASATATGIIGTPSSASGSEFQFVGADPAVTAELDVHNATFRSQSEFSGWGEMLDWMGTDGAVNAFTPSSVYGETSMGISWNSDDAVCGDLPSTLVPGQTYQCGTHATLTFTFSRPVANPILNITNIAGGGTYGSFWSEYRLVEPGTMALRSSAGNLEVHGDGASFGVIQPPGTGFTSEPVAYDLYPTDAHPERYGAGYGAVQIIGSYTTLTFDVTLNYRNFTAAEYGSDVVQLTQYHNLPEWVSFMLAADAGLAGPVVANPQTHSTAVDTAYVGSASVEGNSAGTVYSVTVQPAHGTVVMQPDGTFIYTPNPGYTGSDVFTYQLCDPNDDTNCATSTVTLSIEATTLASTGAEQAAAFTMLASGMVLLGCVLMYRRLVR